MWQRDPHLPISFSWEIWEMRAQITSTNENVRKRQFFVFAPSWASETYQKCYMKISKIVSLDVKNFFWRFSKTFSLLVMEKTLRFCIYNWFHDQYWKRVTVPRWNCRYPSTIATNYHYTASQGPRHTALRQQSSAFARKCQRPKGVDEKLKLSNISVTVIRNSFIRIF